MRTGRHAAVRAADPRDARMAARSSPPVGLRLAVIAVATAVAVLVAGGGGAFWLCVPAALLVCASCRTRPGAVLATAVVIAAAAMPAVAWAQFRPLPSPLLVLLVPIASVTVLVTMRERIEREREALRDFALTDPLTGIANRRSLLGRAGYEIARHHRAGRKFALVMLDLDGFKLLNDRFGHAAGDDLLRDVATALERSMRAQDTVARIGGDEFCVLAPETDGLGSHQLAVRVAQAVGDVTAGMEAIRASVGSAVFPSDGRTATELMLVADHRLLSTKRERQRSRAQRQVA